MVRDTIVALAATGAEHAVARDVGVKPDREVMVAAFTEALDNFMAPTDDEAFMAGIGAIMNLFPDQKDTLMAEARAIGDRSKILSALLNGVPVDMEQVDLADMPEGAVGLPEMFKEAQKLARSAAYR